MISVHNSTSVLIASNESDVSSWIESLAGRFSPTDVDLIRLACDLAAPLYFGQIELTGATLMQHAPVSYTHLDVYKRQAQVDVRQK